MATGSVQQGSLVSPADNLGTCQEPEDTVIIDLSKREGFYSLRLHWADVSAALQRKAPHLRSVGSCPLWFPSSLSLLLLSFSPSESSGFLFSRSGAYRLFLHRCPPHPSLW